MRIYPPTSPLLLPFKIIVMPAESRKCSSTQVFEEGQNPPRASRVAKKSRTTKSPHEKTSEKAKARIPLQEIVNEADYVNAAEAEIAEDEDVEERELYPENGPSSAQPGPFTQQLDKELAEAMEKTYFRCRYKVYCNNKTVDGVDDSNYRQLLSSLTAGEVWRWVDSVVVEMSTQENVSSKALLSSHI